MLGNELDTADKRELVLTRHISAPRQSVYEGWTNPALLRQWFAPAPMATIHAEVDARAGGEMLIVTADHDGTEYPSRFVFLEVDPGKKLVFTDAYRAGWLPSDAAFLTAVITFEDAKPEDDDAASTADADTLYTVRMRHWNTEDADAHRKIGFADGWGQCTNQLEALLSQR